jgi:hypothetical protein
MFLLLWFLYYKIFSEDTYRRHTFILHAINIYAQFMIYKVISMSFLNSSKFVEFVIFIITSKYFLNKNNMECFYKYLVDILYYVIY